MLARSLVYQCSYLIARTESSAFQNITIRNTEQEVENGMKDSGSLKLGFSRAYSLSLSPQILYTRSNLLPALVSSKVYRQLEFLPVGSWWLYVQDGEDGSNDENTGQAQMKSPKGHLQKIPGGREDVFADKSIDRRSMMSLMKFLKLAGDSESHSSILEAWGKTAFSELLESHFKIPPRLREPLLALTSSLSGPAEMPTYDALPRIHRHLTSIGMFGPGFGSVIPKWGGLAEISQVACRAGAVGGGVYVLKKGFETGSGPDQQIPGKEAIRLDSDTQLSVLSLEGGESIQARWVVGSQWDLPSQAKDEPRNKEFVFRSITVISGSLSQLFSPPAEGAPVPASAISVFPVRTLHDDYKDGAPLDPKSDPLLIYLMIHSSNAGECPTGQCRYKLEIFCTARDFA